MDSESGDGQGGLECCDSWGRQELDTTERLNSGKCVYFNCKLLILHLLRSPPVYKKRVDLAALSDLRVISHEGLPDTK